MHEELVLSFKDTLRKSEELFFNDVSESIKSNKIYKEGFVSKKTHRKEQASVIVEACTTFASAKKYLHLGKVCVLNFANPVNPGGGVLGGAIAQEECLCRSSTLYACISAENVFRDYYKYHRELRNNFYSDRLIYTKAVKVFKDDSIVPEMLPENEMFDVDVITCAAPYLAECGYMNPEALLQIFKCRIKNIFEAARDNSVDVIILGAFGCGAFKNPPNYVAMAFEEVIRNEKYCSDFKQIVFAIKPSKKDCPNVYEFSRRFLNFTPDTPQSGSVATETSSDCENNQHKYEVAKENTGGTRCMECRDGEHEFELYDQTGSYDFYKCKKCGEIKQECAWGEMIEVENDGEYVMLPPNKTIILYSDVLRLTIESSGKTIQFQKAVVEVGRDKNSDFLLEGKPIVARRQATFLYEKNTWFLRDNFSTNGTWLNGAKIQPGKKYQLATNDEINFAMVERVIFDKRERNAQPTGDQDSKALTFLEAGMATFAKSNHKDEISLKLIIAALSDAPLFFPVGIDLEAMLGVMDPTKLKVGDTLQPTEDVKMRILTLTSENGVEFVPMFTSNEEVNKGPSASIIRFYPQDYLPKLIQMDKPVIINPFSENSFLLSKQLITEVLLPLVQNKTKPQTDVVEQSDDKYIGKTIDGKYKVLKLIGRGGFYTTYLVENIYINKLWAMKVCDKKNRHYTPVVREGILAEPYMMQKLEHPAIPKIADIIEDEDNIFIIRDYIEGETLEDLVGISGPQPVEEVVNWIEQLCDVIGYLHSRNPAHIYRDVKPDNILLKPDGKIALIDFGIMRLYDENAEKDENNLGTRGYASPEQYGGRGQTDARSDIYSIGVTMHRLLTGFDPTMSTSLPDIRELNPQLPQHLSYMIKKCTEFDRENRYKSCMELKKDLYPDFTGYPPPRKGIFKFFKR